ncbi:MAG: hypothetical protein ABR577_12275 [Pyrinomonadaceae bacterium]
MSETIHQGGTHGGGHQHTPDTKHIQNPSVLHEQSDVNVRAILKFILILAIGTAIVFGIISGLLRTLSFVAEKMDPQTPSPMVMKGEERLPPEPRLQGAPGWNFEGKNIELREPQAEREMLFEKWSNDLEKGGVDPQTGATRIPIEEAKRMIVERNMPARQAQGKQVSGEKAAVGQAIDVPSSQSAGHQTESRDK